MKTLINFTFLLTVSSFAISCFINEVNAKEKLNRRSKINSYIETILDKKFSEVLIKDHYTFYVRVASRDRKLVAPKAEVMHLGKLGDQSLKAKKKKAVYEDLPLVKRLTNVDVVLFVHPVVEKSVVKQMRGIILNETPFVNVSQINIFQYRMVAYPQYFNSPHFFEDFKYWYKLNNELGDSIFRYTSITLIIFLLVGFSWYMAFRRTKNLEKMIHTLTSGSNSEEDQPKEVEKEVLYLSNQVGDDRVKYFFKDLSLDEEKDAS